MDGHMDGHMDGQFRNRPGTARGTALPKNMRFSRVSRMFFIKQGGWTVKRPYLLSLSENIQGVYIF
jgi:hypothetical protein